MRKRHTHTNAYMRKHAKQMIKPNTHLCCSLTAAHMACIHEYNSVHFFCSLLLMLPLLLLPAQSFHIRSFACAYTQRSRRTQLSCQCQKRLCVCHTGLPVDYSSYMILCVCILDKRLLRAIDHLHAYICIYCFRMGYVILFFTFSVCYVVRCISSMCLLLLRHVPIA